MKNKISKTSRKNSKYIYRFLCATVFVIITVALFLNLWISYVEDRHFPTNSLLGMGNLIMSAGLYAAIYIIIGNWLRAFRIGVERKANILANQVLTLLATDFIGTFVSSAISGQFRYYFDLAKMYALLFLLQAIVVCVISIIMTNQYRRLFPPLKILEIYSGIDNGLNSKINEVYNKYNITDRVSLEVAEKELRSRLREFDAVVLNDMDAHNRNKLVKLCFDTDTRVYYVPKLSDIIVKSSEEINQIDAPLFLNRNNGIGPIERFAKRFFDVLFSGIALIIMSPIMLLTAFLIHYEDGGPVFYKQERVTIGGKRFMILKFRSMIVDAEKDGNPRPAGEHDNRITRTGRFIRKVRIDELPQLINIIKGDMSIVGPRPERWEYVEKYTSEIPEFSYRLKMKGGLTGYAQVYGRYNTTALDKLKLDLCYITNYSLLLDLQIIFETVKILLQKESTQGFSEEKIEEMKKQSDQII